MIKFFRKIRQQLLTENKVSKYLLYAIGEIVLVVIGILIALGINNWNQNQIAIEKENRALANLILDLEEQSNQLVDFISGENEYYESGIYLSEHYAKNKEFQINDTLFSKLNILGARITFKPINTTFQELISTGNIGLIRNEKLRRKLIQFFNEMDRISEISAKNNTNIVDALYNPLLLKSTVFIHKYEYESDYTKTVFKDISNDQNRIFDSESLENLYSASRDVLEKPENALNLFNLIQIRTQMANVQLIKYNELNQEIEALIKEIQLELEK
ncbi:DUF6090 family protein [Algoriphagus sp. SE2]|uniref:DUF6090 family protein n=1 Tax=Algoriphagus sp. SE2 TaxID=3141536 RepID=UPI0031CD2B61